MGFKGISRDVEEFKGLRDIVRVFKAFMGI